jgi:hypothetical protein
MPTFTPEPIARVNTTATGDQLTPLVATLAGGGYVIVWTSWAASDLRVYAQRFDELGAKAGNETLVLAGEPGTSGFRAGGVLGLGDGGFVVAADTGRVDPVAGPVSSVYTQRVDVAGQRVGTPVLVDDTGNFEEWVEAGWIYPAADGGYYVAIEEVTRPTPRIFSETWLRHYSADGVATGAKFLVGDGRPEDNLIVLANGNIAAAWDRQTGPSPSQIGWTVLTPTGEPVSSGVIAGTAQVSPLGPVLARAADGYLMIWSEINLVTGISTFLAQVRNASGETVGGPFELALPSNAGLLELTALANGGFVLSWHVFTGDHLEYFGRYLDAAGQPSGDAFRLVPDHPGSPGPLGVDVVASPDGGFVVASQLPGDGTGQDIFGQKFGPDAVTGGDANDRLFGGAGNDLIDGGNGVDTAVYSGAMSRYTIARTDAGVTVTDSTAAEGSDTLVRMERLSFSDTLAGLDTRGPDGHVWQAAALTHTVLGALPPQGLLSQWTAQADQSSGMGELAQKMLDYYVPGISSQDLVTVLFVKLVKASPSPETVQLFANLIGPGKIFGTQGDFFAAAASLPLNTDGMADLVGSIQPLDPAWF